VALDFGMPTLEYQENEGGGIITGSPRPDVPYALLRTADQEGSVVIDGLQPGRYDLRRINGLGAGGYVAEVVQGDHDALLDGILIESGEVARVEVVVRSDAGSVSGVVRDASGALLLDAMVALIPDGPRDDALLATLRRASRTDLTGQFDLDNVAPGSYRMYVWTSEEYPRGVVESYLYLDPTFVDQYPREPWLGVVRANDQLDLQLTLPE
jgi:hypothetical protein